MKETKFTPGPWSIGELRAKGQEVWINTKSPAPRLRYGSWDGLAVAYGCNENRKVGSEVAMANARLIAAAPELLAALVDACRNFPTDGDLAEAGWEPLEIEAACVAYDKARAAISKALGEA